MTRPVNRPRGALRHYAGLVSARGGTALRVANERDAGLRLRRMGQAAADRVTQRRRPSRPRMRALTAAPGGRLRWTSTPAPVLPGPAGAIVRPLAVATCDLDPLVALGASPFPLPLHLGHECVAEVIETGEQVTSVAAGQRVVVPFQVSCGHCAACRAGHTGNCRSVPPVSMYGFGVTGGHWGGAYSDLLAVPYVVVGGVTRHTMLSGSVPLYLALIARALGARSVVLAERRPAVREQAERLGFEVVTPRDLRRRPPVPLVADVSAHPDGHRLALASTAPDGSCSSSGTLHRTMRVPGLVMYARNVTFTMSRAHARTLIPPVLDLIVTGRLHPELVTSTLDSLDDAPTVLREHFLSGGTKAILTA